MFREILLFLHKDIRMVLPLSFPSISIKGIIEYTYRRNKTIQYNRFTAKRFIFFVTTEITKRIKLVLSILTMIPICSVRYINGDYYKEYCKNTYQVVSSPTDGGNRP